MNAADKLKIPRQKMPEQDPKERIKNFHEVPFGYTTELAKKEAQRCLACKKALCVGGCPVEVNIPEFVRLIAEGNFVAAAQELKKNNSLPAICGRVCPQEDQCEKVCTLAKKYEPVAIGNLERFAADYEREQGEVEIPKITQMPAVGEVAEDAAFTDTDQNSAFLSVSVKKYAGQQTFSVELLDRTSPAFFDELVRNMAAAYAKTTNAAVNAALIAGATLDGTTTTTYPTASELLGVVARGSASVYAATAGLPNPFARNMVVSTGQWSNIMSLNDAGRPIYTASQPMNAGGAVAPTSLTGNVAGLNLYVDPTNAGDGDGTILIINPDAYTWYESPTYRLRAESTAAGSVTIGYYGFGAIATKVGAGAFKNNKA